jgi:hypothetical protein
MAQEMKQVEKEVLAVLAAQLPETARVMNAAAITEEIVFGPDHHVLQDDELPEQEVYDRHEAALRSLEGQGFLAGVEVMGMEAHHLTKAGAVAARPDDADEEVNPDA